MRASRSTDGAGEAHGLGDAQAGAVHQLDERPVAHGAGVVPFAASIRRSDSRGTACVAACGFASASRPRRRGYPHGGRAGPGGGSGADGSDAAGDRGGGEAGGPHRRDPAPRVTPSSPSRRARRERCRGREIAAVGVDRARRALRGKQEQIALYLGVGRLRRGSSCGSDPIRRPDAAPALTLASLRARVAAGRTRAAAGVHRRGCRPASSRAKRARGAPGSCAGRRRPRAGASRRRAAAGGGCASGGGGPRCRARRPRTERKSVSLRRGRGRAARPAGSVATACAARSPRGTMRSLPPLPRTWTASCSKSTSASRSPTTSAVRRPHEYVSSRIAALRTARGPVSV